MVEDFLSCRRLLRKGMTNFVLCVCCTQFNTGNFLEAKETGCSISCHMSRVCYMSFLMVLPRKLRTAQLKLACSGMLELCWARAVQQASTRLEPILELDASSRHLSCNLQSGESRAKVLHRDLKPSNIFLCGRCSGSAHHINDEDSDRCLPFEFSFRHKTNYVIHSPSFVGHFSFHRSPFPLATSGSADHWPMPWSW